MKIIPEDTTAAAKQVNIRTANTFILLFFDNLREI